MKVCLKLLSLLLSSFKIKWEKKIKTWGLLSSRNFIHWLMTINSIYSSVNYNQDNQILCFGVGADLHRSWKGIFSHLLHCTVVEVLCQYNGKSTLCEWWWQNIRLWMPKMAKWQILCDWWEIPMKLSIHCQTLLLCCAWTTRPLSLWLPGQSRQYSYSKADRNREEYLSYQVWILISPVVNSSLTD